MLSPAHSIKEDPLHSSGLFTHSPIGDSDPIAQFAGGLEESKLGSCILACTRPSFWNKIPSGDHQSLRRLEIVLEGSLKL